jgi:hypothetical protein
MRDTSMKRTGKVSQARARSHAATSEAAKKTAGSFGKRKLRAADGTLHTVFTLKTGSKTFGDDLDRAFKKSIEQARKQNKQKLGVRDY